jgi:hypothetical protein
MLQGLQNMLGGQAGERVQDFINRYQQGHPSDGVDPDETAEHYNQIASAAPTDVYRDSAQDAFDRLTPDERQQFADWLRERAQQQGIQPPAQLGTAAASGAPSASAMADGVTQLQQEQPNLLQQIFGQGGALSNPLARAAAAGITAMVAQRLMSRR